MPFSVMTFNVRGAFQDDGPNAWPARRALNIATIQRIQPDIFALQEVQKPNLEAYAESLPEYAVEQGRVSVTPDRHKERVPIYWRRDRFEKMRYGGFYLSETPDDWAADWQSKYIRSVTWVRLYDRVAERELVVLNTHFPHETDLDETRAISARLIAFRLEDIAEGSPAIAMADFNARPDSDAYRVFEKAGFVDTFRAAGNTQVQNTFHDFQGSRFAHVGWRIDWILTLGALTTLESEIITDAEPPRYPSDHYPVFARLEYA